MTRINYTADEEGTTGEILTRRAIELTMEHEHVSFNEAFNFAMDQDPELAGEYSNEHRAPQAGDIRSFSDSHETRREPENVSFAQKARAALNRQAKALAFDENLDYTSAFMKVLDIPHNATLVEAYSKSGAQ